MRAFEGVIILDLTHMLAGPYCTYQLALLGADTIKIEPPNTPDAMRQRGVDPILNDALMGINYQTQASNKRSLVLDVATPEGGEILKRLACRADVLVENYRASAMSKLGLGWESLCELNPRLIYCSLTGFGACSDRASLNAYDNIIQAASGLMTRTGTPATGPLKAGAALVDYASGMAAAFAIAAALHERQASGIGQRIDCAMFDTALSMMAPEFAAELHEGPRRPLPSEAGLGCYLTKDGHLMLGAFNVRQNRRLWIALGRSDFAALSSWSDLWSHADVMRSALQTLFLTKTAQEWEDDLRNIGVPAARVRSLAESVELSRLDQRGFIAPVASDRDHAAVHVGVAPFRFNRDGPCVTRAPPQFGEHTNEILTELGCDATEIRKWRAAGVVK